MHSQVGPVGEVRRGSHRVHQFVEAGAAYAADTWGWAVDTSRTSPVADVMTGVSEVVRRVTDPGGPVVLSSPVYNAFFDFVAMTGRRVVDAPLDPSGRLDPTALDTVFGEAGSRGERAAYLRLGAGPSAPAMPFPSRHGARAAGGSGNDMDGRE